MSRVRIPLDRRLKADGGFTLSELLVVIVLFSIIGGIIGTVVRVGLKHQTQMQDRNAAFADARKVIQRVDRDIRAANPLINTATTPLSATSIQMYEYDGTSSTPRVVSYKVVAVSGTTSKLVYQACGTCAEQVLIQNLVQTSSNPVFSFAPTTDYATTYPSQTTTNAATCAFTATPTQYDPSCIGTISVHLIVQPATINQPVNISDNGTELRNAT